MDEPSPWVIKHSALIPKAASILDVACGSGRHTRYFLERGHPVTAVDKNISGLRDVAHINSLEVIETDLEDGTAWPLGTRTFGAVIVINYLYRPIVPALINAVTQGGLLIYDTFAEGNENFGKPSRPDFLLKPGELLDAVKGQLDVAAYEHGLVNRPRSVRQRLCAIRHGIHEHAF